MPLLTPFLLMSFYGMDFLSRKPCSIFTGLLDILTIQIGVTFQDFLKGGFRSANPHPPNLMTIIALAKSITFWPCLPVLKSMASSAASPRALDLSLRTFPVGEFLQVNPLWEEYFLPCYYQESVECRTFL